MCSNGGISLVGPQSDDSTMGCYLMEGRPIIFYDHLILILFELGQSKFVLHTYPHSPNLIAVVVLTIRKGYKDCTFPRVLPDVSRE